MTCWRIKCQCFSRMKKEEKAFLLICLSSYPPCPMRFFLSRPSWHHSIVRQHTMSVWFLGGGMWVCLFPRQETKSMTGSFLPPPSAPAAGRVDADWQMMRSLPIEAKHVITRTTLCPFLPPRLLHHRNLLSRLLCHHRADTIWCFVVFVFWSLRGPAIREVLLVCVWETLNLTYFVSHFIYFPKHSNCLAREPPLCLHVSLIRGCLHSHTHTAVRRVSCRQIQKPIQWNTIWEHV